MFAAMLWQFQNSNNFLPSASTAQFSSENYFNNSILNQQLISTKFEQQKQQNENKFGKDETRTNRLRNDILIDCWEACGSTTELSNVEISPKTSSSTKSIKLYGKFLLICLK